MAPQVLATFRAVFAGSERGKAFGIYGAMLGFASAVGLLLGGVLTDANLFGWSWRSVFFVNVPVAARALIAGLRFVPETKDLGARRPDLPGAVPLAGSLVAIVYPLLEGRQLGHRRGADGGRHRWCGAGGIARGAQRQPRGRSCPGW
jgi:MFS family permease